MRNILILWAVITLGASQGFGGGFSSLKLGADARSGALGMAFTAVSDDGSGGYWNPAGLTSLVRKDFIFSIHRWIGGVRSEFLGFGWGDKKGGIGIHVLYMEVGGIEHRVVPTPVPLATFSNHELIVGFSYARTLKERISVGFTLKVLYEKIFVEEAWGMAADLGILWRVWEGGLRVGGVVQNLGTTGRLRDENVTLPLTGRLGVAQMVKIFGGRWVFIVDGVKERDFPFHLHGGVEYGWRNVVFLRCGYQTGYETRDLTGGVGVVWRGYRLDYSYMPLHAGLGDSHRLSVGISL